MRLWMLLTMMTLALGCSSVESDDDDDEWTRDRCRDDCAGMNFFGDCITAGQQSACQDACLAKTANDAEKFSDCISNNRTGGEDACNINQCLSLLGVSEDGSATNNQSTNNAQTTDPAAGCKSNCDTVNTDCPDGADAVTTSECKAACDSQPADAVTSFNTCVPANRYICEELLPCLDHLAVEYFVQ